VPRVESCVCQSGKRRRCDGCAAGQTCIKALAGAGRLHGRLHGRQLLFLRDVKIRSSTRVGGDARAVRLGPHTSRSWTCRARRRLVARGREGFLQWETGRNAANQLKTRCLSCEGLDEDLHTTT
jgi:hypothetical protein